ncbi:MAG: glutamate-1-semialdehyde 2,1-aminomutase [Rhodobacteraceae bacterium]|nr:glutamate-1-semialdehyde 2,1-aminomutase [Paracoccaceae bacterium]
MTRTQTDHRTRLLNAIPGGAHTYSRGFDTYPSNAPDLMVRGKGCRSWSADGREFVDTVMALASVSIGFAEDEIDEAAIEQIRRGNTTSRPSEVELEAAEKLIDLVDSADMVKFTKNGSTAVTAAVKLARAHTGRNLIARCRQHPFFSYDDWFIGSTPIKKGVPEEVVNGTVLFDYNNLESLKNLVAEHNGDISCVVMEPVTSQVPNGLVCEDSGALPLITLEDFEDCNHCFLHEVQQFCRENGIVFILDEMLTGFRWHDKGAQHLFGLDPDLCTFGKAMANGFSVACVAGHREIMEHGSIEFEGRERMFLLSTTHGAEMSGLGAFVSTVAFNEREKVTAGLWEKGQRLVNMAREIAATHDLSDHVHFGGVACRPSFMVVDEQGNPSLSLRSLMMQEMIRGGVLLGAMNVSHRLDQDAFESIERAFHETMPVLSRGIRDGVDGLLEGPPAKPVFRQFN